jgi:putative hemolysin
VILAVFYQNVWHILLMVFLLTASAFFSGSETAYFNLSRRQINTLHKSRHRLQRLAADILSRPRELLGSLLLGNITVNVCFYSLSAMLAVQVKRQSGATAAGITAAACLGILVMCGEMLPKSVAYLNSARLAAAGALPCYICMKILGPVQSIFNFILVEPAIRLLLGSPKSPGQITVTELKTLIELTRQAQLISVEENQLLGQVVEFGMLKVRQVMRPRVDMVSCSIKTEAEEAKKLMLENGLTKLPVFEGAIDNVLGLVHIRQILLHPNVKLRKLIQKVALVPEQKTVESLLEFFRQSEMDTAVVVDEYGGIAGIVSLEDIVEELLGPLEVPKDVESIEQIGPMQYRLAGNLAIHDWVDAFGISLSQTRLSTIGGLVTALLGKIPRAGDSAYLQNLKFTVERVARHRIETVILSLQPDGESKSTTNAEQK